MNSANAPDDLGERTEDDAGLLDENDAAEEVPIDENGDHPMDSDPDDDLGVEQEITLQNDSIAHFDAHKDSIFSITSHPDQKNIIATGGGDDTTYVWSAAPASRPLPTSYESKPEEPGRPSLPAIAELSGHTDSVNALTFTLPKGDFLATSGLDGKLRIHSTKNPSYPLLAEAQEVPEINFLAPCPAPQYPNTLALGASDGSVWVYSIDPSDKANPLQVIQAYYLHTESCTAGAWSPDGKLLATVSEDGSLYIWDPFGEATAAGVTSSTGQAIVGLTAEDARFAVEGGLYSVAIAPNGAFVAVGGAGGMIRVVGLPRLSTGVASTTQSMKGGGAKNKSGGARKNPIQGAGPATGQAGQILASLQVQSDGVETLAFSPAPLTLLAAGSVDGSIALFDTAHRFAVRRHIKEAHEGFAAVKVEFERGSEGHLLISCGMDGVVRRWDTRGGTAAAGQGLVKEWRGHRGEGEGGGVLGYVLTSTCIVTAGDDGVGLVFRAEI